MPEFKPGQTVLIPCEIGVGQFVNEFSVSLRSANDREFSLFAPKDYVDYERAPTRNETVRAWLRVLVADRKGQMVLIRLPRQAIENGEFVTVREDQFERERQEA